MTIRSCVQSNITLTGKLLLTLNKTKKDVKIVSDRIVIVETVFYSTIYAMAHVVITTPTN